MTSVIYTNSRGESIEIGLANPYILEKIDGSSGLKNELIKQKSPYQDGSTIVSSSLDVRPIDIQGAIKAKTRDEVMQYRHKLLRIFNPKLKGTLKYIYEAGEKEIPCEVEQAPVFVRTNVTRIDRFLINLVAANPYFLDTSLSQDEIITWIGGWKLKFKLPFKFKTKGETKKNIYNSGHVETPIAVIFKGPAVNPSIINHTTGDFIKVNRTLTSDDTLIINTAFGNKKVEIERNGLKTNAFNYIDLDSTFFSLVVGDNLIEYTTESLEPQSVEIRYKNRYLGV